MKFKAGDVLTDCNAPGVPPFYLIAAISANGGYAIVEPDDEEESGVNLAYSSTNCFDRNYRRLTDAEMMAARLMGHRIPTMDDAHRIRQSRGEEF